jgi:hypothetical protein
MSVNILHSATGEQCNWNGTHCGCAFPPPKECSAHTNADECQRATCPNAPNVPCTWNTAGRYAHSSTPLHTQTTITDVNVEILQEIALHTPTHKNAKEHHVQRMPPANVHGIVLPTGTASQTVTHSPQNKDAHADPLLHLIARCSQAERIAQLLNVQVINHLHLFFINCVACKFQLM